MINRTTAVLFVTALTFFGCGGEKTPPESSEGTTGSPQAPKHDLLGVIRKPGLPRPRFVLPTIKGDTFDFFERTKGRVTMLFYGYTNCAAACPATMAIVSRAFDQLTSEQRSQLDFVFVTTDPQRDTPEVLESWLKKFDDQIIGLTGTPDQVAKALQAAHVGAAKNDTTSLNYGMWHSTQVFVFSPDDSAHVEYPFGYREPDFVSDLPKLLTKWPAKTRG